MNLQFGLPEIVAGLMLVALNAYALTGGADFGGGWIDLVARGPRRDAQRTFIAESLAPIWEANHVWLIVVIVLMFTGFPDAFQAIAIVLHIPLTLLLIGIVARGSAFVFRAYGSKTSQSRNRWGRVFAVASTITPVLLGTALGAISTGRVGQAGWRVDSGTASFAEIFLAPWLGAYQLSVGFFALALFAFLAAVYLAYAAKDDGLRDDFRGYALRAAAAVFVLAAVVLALSWKGAPRVAIGVMGTVWAIPLHVLTGIAAIIAIAALWQRRYAVARIAAAAQVTFILWGWALSQYPYIVPDIATIRNSAAPPRTLTLVVIGLVVGSLILIPSLRYLLNLFATRGTHGNARGTRKTAPTGHAK